MNPLLKFLLMSLGIFSCLANIGMTLDTGDLLGGVLGGGGSSGVGGLLGGLLGGGNSGGNSGGNNPFEGKNVKCGSVNDGRLIGDVVVLGKSKRYRCG